MTNVVELKVPEPKSDKSILNNIFTVLELAKKRKIIQTVLISIEDDGKVHLTLTTPEREEHFNSIFDALEKVFEFIITIEEKTGGDN